MTNGGDRADFEDLERLVDERLDPEARARVLERIGADPAAAALVEAHRHVSGLLRRRLDPVLDEPVPARLLEAAVPPAARPRAGAPAWALAAAVAAAAVLAGLGGWLGRGAAERPPPWEALVTQALDAETARVGTGDTAAARALWGALGAPVGVPRLDAEGFRLLGGALLPAGAAPAARLVYVDGAGRRVALYLRADLANEADVKFRFVPGAGLTVLYWLDGPRGYALLGDIDRERMLRVAEAVYRQIEA